MIWTWIGLCSDQGLWKVGGTWDRLKCSQLSQHKVNVANEHELDKVDEPDELDELDELR